jgi:hypothetical protein
MLVAVVMMPQAELGEGNLTSPSRLIRPRVFMNSAIIYPPMRTNLIAIESYHLTHMFENYARCYHKCHGQEEL